MIHGHGDDAYLYGQIKANFSSNVYRSPELSLLQQHLCQSIDLIHAYPEPDAHSLAELIAEKKQIFPDQVCITNGATEAIYLIAQAFRQARTAVLSPVFSEYADACFTHEHQVKHLFSLSEPLEAFDLVWVCNPNNPQGIIYPKAELVERVQQYPETTFVFDHSYEDFIEEELISAGEAVCFPNLVLLHSMTKHYAIPGLRLGYISGAKQILQRISRFCMPWSVNSLAIEAGKFLLTHSEKVRINQAALLAETERLQNQLKKINKLTVYPTKTHFFLVKLPEHLAAKALKTDLAEKHQILIRDAANFVGLGSNFFRIATQTREENDILASSISFWMQEQEKGKV